MTPAFPVFCFVVDLAVQNLDFADGVITLEVGTVIHSIPETELDEAEEVDVFCLIRVVGQRDSGELTAVLQRNEDFLSGRESILASFYNGISQTVPAAVAVQFGLHRLPARVPDCVAVLNIIVVSVTVRRCVVVAVAGQPQKAVIPAESISAGGIGNQTEEIMAAQIVDPGQGSPGVSDHIFLMMVVEVSVLHV